MRKRRVLLLLGILVVLVGVSGFLHRGRPWSQPTRSREIGADSPKLRQLDGKTFVWAGGEYDAEDSEWFDISGAPLEAAKFQYGIGKDKIVPIDDPQFADADDPRLGEQGIDNESRVIGYELNGDARAYPLKILDNHELVNDVIGGKPVTVGW